MDSFGRTAPVNLFGDMNRILPFLACLIVLLPAMSQGLFVSWNRFVPTLSEPFSPTNISGMVWWHKGDTGNVGNTANQVQTNTGIVGYWTNAQDNVRRAQATGNLVYYVTNDLGEVRFSPANNTTDGNPYYFEPGLLTTNAQPLTIFCLVKMSHTNQVSDNTQYWIDSGFNIGAANEISMGCTNNNFFVFAGTRLLGGTIQTNKWYYQTFVVNGASSELRVNGTQVLAGDVGANNLAKMYLGDYLFTGGGTGRKLIGRIAELLVYNTAFTTNQMLDVEGYLTNKYSLSP